MTKENKEEKILEAAIKIFSEKGYSAATTSEIAREAEVAEGTIFRYFKTKKDILRKVMVKLIGVVGEKLITVRIGSLFKKHKGKDEKEVFKAIIMDRIELLDEYWELIKVVLTEVQYHEDLREVFIKNIALRGKEVLNEFIQQGMDNGVFRKLDPSVVTRSVVGIFGVFLLQNKLAPELIDMNVEEQIDLVIDILYNGISNKGE